MEKFDPKLITENLTELLTNTINISSLFYRIFIDPVADSNISLDQWVYKNGSMYIETTTGIKNIAAIEQELKDSMTSVIAGETLSNYVKFTDFAKINKAGVIKVDGETVNLNSDGQLSVQKDSITVKAAETATSATISETANTIFNLNLSSSDSIIKMWVGTQEQYDSLTPVNDTLYFIKDE